MSPTLTNKKVKSQKSKVKNENKKSKKRSSNIQYSHHTNFTLELQYLLMDVIVINNSYHIYSKVNVGA